MVKDDQYVCKKCGEDNVIVKGWINLNSRELLRHTVEYDNTYCYPCKSKNEGVQLRWKYSNSKDSPPSFSTPERIEDEK